MASLKGKRMQFHSYSTFIMDYKKTTHQSETNFLKITFDLFFFLFSLTIFGNGLEKCDDNIVRKHFSPELRRAPLPRIRFHNLGHPYARLLIHQDEYPKYIQGQIVHSSIKVTMDIYGHSIESINQKATTLLIGTVLGDTSDQSKNEMVCVQSRRTIGRFEKDNP
jgi:integrase